MIVESGTWQPRACRKASSENRLASDQARVFPSLANLRRPERASDCVSLRASLGLCECLLGRVLNYMLRTVAVQEF